MSGRFTPPRRRPDGAALIIAVALAVLGAVLWWDAARLPQAGGYAGVGPADTPRMVGLGLFALAAWTAVAGWRDAAPPPPRQELGPVVWVVGGLAAQLALLGVIGFAPATGLLFACVARAFGRRNLALTIPIGVAFSLAVYGVFDQILSLNLPAGPLETLIFGG